VPRSTARRRPLLTADVAGLGQCTVNEAAQAILAAARALARGRGTDRGDRDRRPCSARPDQPDAQPRMVELKAVQPRLPFLRRDAAGRRTAPTRTTCSANRGHPDQTGRARRHSTCGSAIGSGIGRSTSPFAA
jgi:hypothetical protein